MKYHFYGHGAFWNETYPHLIPSCPLLHWPYSHPYSSPEYPTGPAHPLPQHCTGVALKLSKHPASHTPHVDRVHLKHTNKRANKSTHTHATHTQWITVFIQPRALTQVGQSCSGSSKQSPSTMELITVSEIKFYLQPWQTHTLPNIT